MMHIPCLSFMLPLNKNLVSFHSVDSFVSRVYYTSSATMITTWGSQHELSTQAIPLILRRPQKSTFIKIDTVNLTTTVTQTSPADEYNTDDDASCITKTDSSSKSCSPIDILRLMDGLQLPVEDELYLSLIKECTESSDVIQGALVHSHMQRHRRKALRQPAGILLNNRLLLMYAACGKLESAYQLFEQMFLRDAISWTTMIVAFSASREHRALLQLFVNMCRRDGLCRLLAKPSCWLDIFVAVFNSCAQLRELRLGQQVHGLTFKVIGGCDAIMSADVKNSLVLLYSIAAKHHSEVTVYRSINSQGAVTWTI